MKAVLFFPHVMDMIQPPAIKVTNWTYRAYTHTYISGRVQIIPKSFMFEPGTMVWPILRRWNETEELWEKYIVKPDGSRVGVDEFEGFRVFPSTDTDWEAITDWGPVDARTRITVMRAFWVRLRDLTKIYEEPCEPSRSENVIAFPPT